MYRIITAAYSHPWVPHDLNEWARSLLPLTIDERHGIPKLEESIKRQQREKCGVDGGSGGGGSLQCRLYMKSCLNRTLFCLICRRKVIIIVVSFFFPLNLACVEGDGQVGLSSLYVKLMMMMMNLCGYCLIEIGGCCGLVGHSRHIIYSPIFIPFRQFFNDLHTILWLQHRVIQ